MKLSELMCKRVICLGEGKEIGFVSDAVLSQQLEIKCIIVCERRRGLARFCPFLFEPKCEKIDVIHISSIGCDVILVKKDRKK